MLLSSTKKLFGSKTEIPIESIAYVQVGAEELEEQHRDLVEPSKTLSSSLASLYISAGKASVRIRLPDEGAATSLATDIRELIRNARNQADDARGSTNLTFDEDEIFTDRDNTAVGFEVGNVEMRPGLG